MNYIKVFPSRCRHKFYVWLDTIVTNVQYNSSSVNISISKLGLTGFFKYVFSGFTVTVDSSTE